MIDSSELLRRNRRRPPVHSWHTMGIVGIAIEGLAACSETDHPSARRVEAAKQPLASIQEQKLEPSTAYATANDYFGAAVALSDGLALVGSYLDDSSSGSAYLFERQTDGSWLQRDRLKASPAAAGSLFGYSVALLGERVLVGASGESSGRGAAYLFERTIAGTWGPVAAAKFMGESTADQFGASVSLTADRALVGAPLGDAPGVSNSGSAYVFERQLDGSWPTIAATELFAGDPQSNDQFGASVAFCGNRSVIGAPLEDTRGGNAGAAYVFERQPDGSFAQQAKLLATDGAANDEFGRSVSLDGDLVLIGAARRNASTGAAYVFERQADGTWAQIHVLLAPDGGLGDSFGSAVALFGEQALVGALLDNGVPGSGGIASAGAAYFFDRQGGSWNVGTKVVGDVLDYRYFGASVSLSGANALVGAPGDKSTAGIRTGIAYAYGILGDQGEPCSEASECVTGFCVDGVCCESACDSDPDPSCTACSLAQGSDEDGVCVVANDLNDDGQSDCDELASCANSPGGLTCSCPPGYDDVNADGTLCLDIDECALGTDNCDALATCSNFPGGFSCSCPPGYDDVNGDGTLCECASHVLTPPPPVFTGICSTAKRVSVGEATASSCGAPVNTSGRVIATNGHPLGTPISIVGGQATLGVGLHTVEWIAEGLPIAAQLQQVTVAPAIQAGEQFLLEDRSAIRSGSYPAAILNSGQGQTRVGNDATAGGILSKGPVSIWHRATITGSIVSEGSVFIESDATVSGTVTQYGSVSLPPLPTLPSFPWPTGGNLVVNAGSTVNLTPGSYASVTVNSGATFVLSGGNYFFQNLALNATTIVYAASTTRIFVRDQLAYRSPFRAQTGGYRPVFLGFNGSDLQMEVRFDGTLVAPAANVSLGSGSGQDYAGAFYARALQIRPDGTLQCDATRAVEASD